jgi:cell division protein FtsW (lipid II flippase)
MASGIILLPTFLVLLQGDAGSALVFLSIFLVLFREGMAIWIPVLFMILGLLFVLALKYDMAVVLPLLLFATGFFLLASSKRKQHHVIIGVSAVLLSVMLMILSMQAFYPGSGRRICFIWFNRKYYFQADPSNHFNISGSFVVGRICLYQQLSFQSCFGAASARQDQCLAES